jgi:hypothetical protein
MTDNTMNRSPVGSRINIYDPDEVRFWCGEFSVTPRELRHAVDTVGELVDDVKKALARLPVAP